MINTGHTFATAIAARPSDEQAETDREQAFACRTARQAGAYAPPWTATNTSPTPRKTAADDASVSPKRRSPNSENVASNAVNATTMMKPMIARWRRIGDVGALTAERGCVVRSGDASRAAGSSRRPR